MKDELILQDSYVRTLKWSMSSKLRKKKSKVALCKDASSLRGR